MKKNYSKPEAFVNTLSVKDILTISGGEDNLFGWKWGDSNGGNGL